MKLAGLILAGGRSQRMGQDKALLEIDGVPLLRQTWEVADSLTSDVWVVTPYRDRYAALLPTKTQWVDELLPADAAPPGPLVALGQALPVIEADWVLLLACDLPNLRVEALRQWVQVLPGLSPDAIAYVPKTARGWEPLCGFYRRSCLSSLQAYSITGKRSFQVWLNQVAVVPISDVPVGLLANCNTPADWQRLTKR